MTSTAFCYPAYDFNPPQQSRKNLPQNLIGGAALVWVVAAASWAVYHNVAGPRSRAVDATETMISIADADAPSATAAPRRSAAARIASAFKAMAERTYDAELLFSSKFSLGFRSGTFADNAALTSDQFVSSESIDVASQDGLTSPPTMRQLVQSIPMPAPKPSTLRARQEQDSRVAVASKPAAIAIATATTSDTTGSLSDLFGSSRSSSSASLAYAPADGGLSGDKPGADGPFGYDRQTAVYDISAHTVYMPDGSKLEAHSGLGEFLDDPKRVATRNRGATPPHVYDLELRESLFHGVAALRLNPVGGEDAVFGRSGLLAHTYMLGPRGDSNGCVSFRDYDAFLRAYRNQQVKRLAVVTRL
jgi:hypothetical protein